MARPHHPLALALTLCVPFLTAVSVSGCNKEGAESEAPAAAAEPEPVDLATTALLDNLRIADRDATLALADSPLLEDLSPVAFEDISKVVSYLGAVHSQTPKKSADIMGGVRRTYELACANGTVDFEVSYAHDKVIGFHFLGESFREIERAAIAADFREFKVYDFAFVTQEGQKLGEGEAKVGQVYYAITVGGIEAFMGEHHLKIQKVVWNEAGKELYRAPIEYDLKFEQNAEGIPRGVVKGYLEFDDPGKHKVQFTIMDNVAHTEVTYETEVEIGA